MTALQSLTHFRPELVLIGSAICVLTLDVIGFAKKTLGWLSLTAIITAIGLCLNTGGTQNLFSGFFLLDPLTQFFKITVLLLVGLVILASLSFEKFGDAIRGELYFALISLAFLLITMAGAANLLMIYIAIESVSITSYLLVAFQKYDKRAAEAALKYLLFGSVSSAVMLFGISFLFMAARTLDLAGLGMFFTADFADFRLIGTLGLVLMFAGLGFKVSAVPFHMWAPDVYQGAPTPIAALLTVAPKAIGFVVICRLLLTAFPEFVQNWSFLLVIISILTMTVGNIIAISQADIKRLLAYSSIAQAGYLLAAIAIPGTLGLQSVLIYLVAYIFTNLGAFFAVLAVERKTDSNDLSAYHGLSERSPLLAVALTLFLVSLAGIPPMAGFIGKFFVFSAAVNAHQWTLAIAISLNSAVAAYYYFRVVKAMYFIKAENKEKFANPLPINIAIGITLVITILIGIIPGSVLPWIERALSAFPVF